MKRIVENFLILLIVLTLFLFAMPLFLIMAILKVMDWLLVKLHLKKPRPEERLCGSSTSLTSLFHG